MISVAKKKAKESHVDYRKRLKKQIEYKAALKEKSKKKKYKKAAEEYKSATFLLQQYHSPRCWKTANKARRDFKMLPSDTKRREACQEQILIRRHGCGMEEAYTTWQNKTAEDLLEFFVKKVLPLAKLKKYKHINEDAVLDLPKLAERVQFGTESSDMTHYYEEQEKLTNELKKETMKERDREEDEGYYDQFEYMQEYI